MQNSNEQLREQFENLLDDHEQNVKDYESASGIYTRPYREAMLESRAKLVAVHTSAVEKYKGLVEEELPHILLCAFRYALGRKTYITSTCANWLKKHWAIIPPAWQAQIVRDIENAIATEQAGHKCDVEAWHSVVAHSQALAAIEAQQNTAELPAVGQDELKALGIGCRRKAERRVNPASDPRTMMTGCRRENDRRKV